MTTCSSLFLRLVYDYCLDQPYGLGATKMEDMELQGKLVNNELSDLSMRRLLGHCDCSECRRQERAWLRLP